MKASLIKLKGFIKNIGLKFRLKDHTGLLPEEQRFVALTKSMGLDWETTRQQFAAKHGVKSYHGWSDVVYLPETTAFSKTPLTFHMYFDGRFDKLAPEYVSADFLRYKDARRNFAELENELVAKLGQGTRCDVSNCLTREWKFGIFEITLRAFPPELQHLGTTNTLHQKNPDLAFAARVAICSELAYIYPDQSLSWIATMLRSKKPRGNWSTLKIEQGYPAEYYNISVTRRNPAALSEAIEEKEQIAWRNEDQKQFGISAKNKSVVFEKKPGAKLILRRIQPARGSGGSEIVVDTDPVKDPRHPWDKLVKIIEHGEFTGLDMLATKLAEFWSLPIEQELGMDD